MSVRNPVVLENAKLQFSPINAGTKDFRVECKGFVLSRRVMSYPTYLANVLGDPSQEGLWFILGSPSEVRLTFSDLVAAKTWPSLPDYSFNIVCQADRDGLLQVNEKTVDISSKAGDDLTIPVILGRAYGYEATIVLEKFAVYLDTLDPDPDKCVFSLQYTGEDLPYDEISGERATLVSGSIRPLYPVTRVSGQEGPGYRFEAQGKIEIPDLLFGESGTIRTVFRWADRFYGGATTALLFGTGGGATASRFPFAYVSNTGTVACFVGDGSSYAAVVSTNAVHKGINTLIMRWGDGVLELELNGVKTQTTYTLTPTQLYTFYIGMTDSYGGRFVGDVLDFKAFSSWVENPETEEADLFQLGKSAGDVIFNAVNPTQTGSILGNVEVVSKEVCWALEFDGDGYIETNWTGVGGDDPRSCLVSIATNQIGGVLLDYGADDVGARFTAYIYSKNVFRIEVRGGNHLWLASSIDDLTPHVIVFTVYGSTTDQINLFMDGEELTTTSITSQTINTSTAYPLRIGGPQVATWLSKFVGVIHLPVIFIQDVWDQETIARLSQRDFSVIDPKDTVLYLDYDPSTGQLVDRSPFNHSITINGGTKIKRVML